MCPCTLLYLLTQHVPCSGQLGELNAKWMLYFAVALFEFPFQARLEAVSCKTVALHKVKGNFIHCFIFHGHARHNPTSFKLSCLP